MGIKRKILFVDDEPRILKGLQRMLHKMRNEWDLYFAESGLEALEMLKQESFDVVVSDMRMPGIDGSQLLSEVQKNYPMVVRIVLSGQSDQETILKSVRPAHQYLSKPCNPELLRATISRACALRDLLKEESLKRLVSQTEIIPSLPDLHARIVEALRNDAPIKEIGEIISKDPAMTAKILQLVNSAFFGIPQHVSSPVQAVQLLGLDTVKSLAFTIEVFSEFSKVIQKEINIGSIYEHSLLTGALSRKISVKENEDKETIDYSFMAGMLHDVGKLILISNLPEEYVKVIRIMKNRDTDFYRAEIEHFGASHAEIGAYLLGLWGLPDPIVEAVAFHHNPSNAPVNSFSPLTAVYCANITINRAKTRKDGIVDIFDLNYLESLNLSNKIQLWDEILKKIKSGDHNE